MIAYLEGPSPIHSLDPRIKIAWSVAVSLLAVIFRQPWFLAGLFATTLLPWCLVRPPLSRLRLLLAAVGTTVFGTTLSQGFFYALEPRTELLKVLPGLSLSAEGLWYGGVVSLRLLAVLAAGTLVVFTTHPADLILALTKLGLPHWFSFMLTLALRFLPETIEQAKRILVAQQLRGAGGRGLLSAARQFRLLVVPLVTTLLRSARQIAMAAEVRAYSARRVPSRELRFSQWDWVLLVGLTMLTVAGCVAAWPGGPPGMGAIR